MDLHHFTCGLSGSKSRARLEEERQKTEPTYLQGKCLSYMYWILLWGFPGGSDSKESACNMGDLGSFLGSGWYPGEGNGNTLQYSRLENSMDSGAWWATSPRGCKESYMTQWLTLLLSCDWKTMFPPMYAVSTFLQRKKHINNGNQSV